MSPDFSRNLDTSTFHVHDDEYEKNCPGRSTKFVMMSVETPFGELFCYKLRDVVLRGLQQ